jgi:hypothetical protein
MGPPVCKHVTYTKHYLMCRTLFDHNKKILYIKYYIIIAKESCWVSGFNNDKPSLKIDPNNRIN